MLKIFTVYLDAWPRSMHLFIGDIEIILHTNIVTTESRKYHSLFAHLLCSIFVVDSVCVKRGAGKV